MAGADILELARLTPYYQELRPVSEHSSCGAAAFSFALRASLARFGIVLQFMLHALFD